MRPHGISPEPFPVYPPDLRIEVTVAFWILLRDASSSAQYAFLSGFCPSGHGFAIASSRLHLTMQTLQVAIGFVGNYAPWDFHPRFGTCPSYISSHQFNWGFDISPDTFPTYLLLKATICGCFVFRAENSYIRLHTIPSPRIICHTNFAVPNACHRPSVYFSLSNIP